MGSDYRLSGLAALSPQEKQRLLQVPLGPFARLLDITLVEIESGFAKLKMPFRPELTHAGGVVQGGIITTLADAAIAVAVRGAMAGYSGHSTIELKINLMRPVGGGELNAEAWLLHLGRTTAVGEAVVLSAEGKVVAKCLSSLMLNRPDNPTPSPNS